MINLLRVLLLVAAILPGASALAVIETYEFDTDALYERYKVLSDELRCPKCQNQNIAASNAPIAQDLRKQLHQQLHEGKSDDEIVDFMVQRYGEFVLYRPRWSAATALLWLAPALLLGLGIVIVASIMRKRSPVAAGAAALGDEEQARLQSLLNSDPPAPDSPHKEDPRD